MKKSVLLLGLTALLFTACKDQVTETISYKINEPVFMSSDEFRNSVKMKSNAEPISACGKICFYKDYLYICEADKGIHIIDNHDPVHPQNIGFIEVLGNSDLAIRNGLLYADSYVDLIWFDITDPAQPSLKGRLENVFETALPPVDNYYGLDYGMCFSDEGKSKGVVVGWTLSERTEDVTHYTGGWWSWGLPEKYYDLATSGINTTGGSAGINGSMSRFSLYQNYLYTVSNNYMTIFDVSGTEPVKATDNLWVGNVETLFSYKDDMFMGTPTGMLIYSVKDPVKPEYVSSMTHVFGCDPVVVDNDMAYVTVHSGNLCGQNSNELFIVDVSDVANPKQLVSYTMTNPKGLGIDSNKLFLCDDGLKVYKITKPETLLANKLAHYTGMDGFDVIPYNNTLMMIATDGLYQYDYSNPDSISLLSKIKIGL